MPPADMRKTMLVAVIAAVGGFCLASVPAMGALRYNIWSQSGEQFQLGYVIGYLDAVGLARRNDSRAQIPIVKGKDFQRWVNDVNAFYADPSNQTRPVPDALYEAGLRVRQEQMKSWQQRSQKPPLVPSPSPAP